MWKPLFISSTEPEPRTLKRSSKSFVVGLLIQSHPKTQVRRLDFSRFPGNSSLPTKLARLQTFRTTIRVVSTMWALTSYRYHSTNKFWFSIKFSLSQNTAQQTYYTTQKFLTIFNYFYLTKHTQFLFSFNYISQILNFHDKLTNTKTLLLPFFSFFTELEF
jgi:hypothetical protein